MNPPQDTLTWRKKAVFAAITLVLFALLAEVALRCVYFQIRADSPLAGISAVQTLRNRAAMRKTQQLQRRLEGTYRPSWNALFGEPGEELLAQFQQTYAVHFRRLASSCNREQTRLVVVYLPSSKIGDRKHAAEPIARAFFRDLTEQAGVTFLDLTDTLRSHRWSDITLLPADDHLSRFGCKIVARALGQRLRADGVKRSEAEYDGTPARCGDLAPRLDEIWTMDRRMPFRVVTNRQGFRNLDDLEIPKRRPRILMLGDSFTFGPYLPNHDTIPHLLQQEFPEFEVVNAGVIGYSIVQQAELFADRARHVAPDVTVLQVVDNDLYGMFYFKQNIFGRGGKRTEPTPLEIRFFQRIGLPQLADIP